MFHRQKVSQQKRCVLMYRFRIYIVLGVYTYIYSTYTPDHTPTQTPLDTCPDPFRVPDALSRWPSANSHLATTSQSQPPKMISSAQYLKTSQSQPSRMISSAQYLNTNQPYYRRPYPPTPGDPYASALESPTHTPPPPPPLVIVNLIWLQQAIIRQKKIRKNSIKNQR